MRSNFLQNMENYQGDLADIVRASGGATTGSLANNIQGQLSSVTDWQFMGNQIDYLLGVEEQLDEFGDPFSNTRDPLLHDLDMAGSCFFNNTSTSSTDVVIRSNLENTGRFVGGGGGGGGGGGNSVLSPEVPDEENRRPSDNIFSRMLQISPNAKLPVSPRDSPALAAASPRGRLKPPTLPGNEMISAVNSSKGSFVENGGVQISSPRSTGIKRRKSQAKKVVCIPAPTPANSRPSGEVVPSDLWAWRKYGQKPIKGSPYPRGYYRCSSSKGCSARKQVERSRTDPNMLVITYTSEHNHPWPTQRNALAGSTRSQPSKTGSASKTTTGNAQVQRNTNLKEERKESLTDNISSSIVTGSSSTGPSVKEEVEDLDKQMEMDDVEFSEGFQQSYKPSLPDSNRSEDFFADLGELEADPLNVLFTQGYPGGEGRENKAPLDPFSFYDWTDNNSHGNNHINNHNDANTNTNANNYSIEEESNKGS